MADVTVARPQRDDVLTGQAEAPKSAEAPSFPSLPWPLIVLWAGFVVGTLAFLLFGSLLIGAGNRLGRRVPVRQIWSQFLGYLVDHGATPAIVVAVSAAAGLAFIAAGIALWFAFSLKDQQPEVLDESTGM